MVQGQTKGLQKAKNTGSRHAQKAAAGTKKGKRYIAPKKAGLVKQAALHKVSSPSARGRGSVERRWQRGELGMIGREGCS